MNKREANTIISEPDFSAFKNRLTKNVRHLSKWAKRQHIECFRVYDRDIPEFPFTVEIYANYAQIAEFDRKITENEADLNAFREQIMSIVASVLNIDPKQIAYKFRRRQRGLDQYEKINKTGEFIPVFEHDLKFLINLHDYLDTGLFLDHRPLRIKMRELALNKTVLNLFAYTGSFTVYCAAGGALKTTTVDLSNTYLEWAQNNLKLNQLNSPNHEFIRADVLNWLTHAIKEQRRYDLIIIDPPSFSNSKKMQTTLDIQRDHELLIHEAMRLLNPSGILFFSNNRRGFKLSPELFKTYSIEEISKWTIPEDFRNKKIHQSFKITHSI